MKYDHKVIIEDNRKIDNNMIKNINELYKSHPNLKIVMEISSTKYLSSELINKLPKNLMIRVSGGYDKERVARNKNKKYDNGETGIFYEEAVIYTRDELAEIVKEFEIIESGYHPNWSKLQLIVYTYDKLKREIMYDPESNHKPTSETSSLRGILSKKTICSGYALIFKEIMDRNGIDCEYVEGYRNKDDTGDHAWNIINLDGQKYPIDITKDNAWFRSGKIHSLASFKEDITTFANEHHPYKEEKTQNYEETLSKFNPEVIDLIEESINKEREYNNTTYNGTRKDGSNFTVTCIGGAIIEDIVYFRYYYEEIEANGQKKPPIILYSENNLTSLMYSKLFGKETPSGYEESINNILFSKENIKDSLTKKSFYIGHVDKSADSKVIKPDEFLKIFSMHTKILERSNGTNFIIQQIPRAQQTIDGINVYEYDIVETINKKGKNIVKMNTVYSENDFYGQISQDVIDKFLSRARIDTTSEELGGYLGYYEEDVKYHPELLTYFKNIYNENISQNSNKKR